MCNSKSLTATGLRRLRIHKKKLQSALERLTFFSTLDTPLSVMVYGISEISRKVLYNENTKKFIQSKISHFFISQFIVPVWI